MWDLDLVPKIIPRKSEGLSVKGYYSHHICMRAKYFDFSENKRKPEPSYYWGCVANELDLLQVLTNQFHTAPMLYSITAAPTMLLSKLEFNLRNHHVSWVLQFWELVTVMHNSYYTKLRWTAGRGYPLCTRKLESKWHHFSPLKNRYDHGRTGYTIAPALA